MRARADAGIFLAAPVDQIVLAFRARPGVVGNLVGRKAVMRADFLRHIVERAGDRLVRRLQFARRMQAEERRAFLDRELIERQMFGGFRNRQLQFVGPHLRRLVGAGVDQVERVAVERGARDRDRIQRLARAVQPSQRLQRSIVERLHAERDAVDAGCAIAAKPRCLDAGRIGLQRHFDIGGDAPMLADRIQDGADGLRLHQRRRAAAEKDRGDGSARRARRRGFDLARKGAHKSFLVDRRVPDMAVEIAIRAFRQAERPVHVDAERSASRCWRSALAKADLRQFDEGAGAVRQAEPERRQAVLLDRGHLAEGPVVSVGQERRIIAETGGAARRPDQSSIGARLDLFEMAVGPGDAQRRDEMRLALAPAWWRRVPAAGARSASSPP